MTGEITRSGRRLRGEKGKERITTVTAITTMIARDVIIATIGQSDMIRPKMMMMIQVGLL